MDQWTNAPTRQCANAHIMHTNTMHIQRAYGLWRWLYLARLLELRLQLRLHGGRLLTRLLGRALRQRRLPLLPRRL